MRLTDQVAIITGSSAGIGKVIAERFLQEGAAVVINSRDSARAAEAAKELQHNGNKEVLAVGADVAQPDQCRELMSRTLARWGKIDILVNNAGTSAIGDSSTIPHSGWQETIAVNLSGAFYCCQAAAELAMIPQRSGCMINISSILGVVGLDQRAAYCASKHGLIGLTKALAIDWARFGIRVNTLCPGYTLTPLELEDSESGVWGYSQKDIIGRTPLGRYGTPEEQAAVCAWLASTDASYVTGASIMSDGGWTAYGGWESIGIDSTL